MLGAALHAALVIAPLVFGTAVGLVARELLPASWAFVLPPWVVAGSLGMVAVWSLQPLTRRLLPLSWLLKLGMLFPGRAPTRFRIARQAGRLQDLEARLAASASATDESATQRSAELILALVTALTAHDRRTRGHAERTRVFTDLLSEELGLPREDRDKLRWAALLHDIGKLEVSQRLLNKPGRPTTREWEQLRRHPEAGDRLVEPLRDWLGEWADTVLHHHERWDGGGYPAGLAGEQIALGARIVAVADVYDVMTAVRSYKRPSSAGAARRELVDCAGSQFDPGVVRALLSIPLPRLRWALGPLAWVAQLPGLRESAHAGASVQLGAQQAAAAAPGAVGAAAAATGLVAGSKVAPPPPVVAVESAAVEATGPSTVEVRPAPYDLEAEAPARSREVIQAVVQQAAVRGATPLVGAADDEVAGGGGERRPEDRPVRSQRPTPAGATADADPGPADRRPAAAEEGRVGRDRGAARAEERGQGGGPRGDGAAGGEPRAARPVPPGHAERADEEATTAADVPVVKLDCVGGGWEDLGFTNQGLCVRTVETGKDARERE
jgi:hypothetical protein